MTEPKNEFLQKADPTSVQHSAVRTRLIVVHVVGGEGHAVVVELGVVALGVEGVAQGPGETRDVQGEAARRAVHPELPVCSPAERAVPVAHLQPHPVSGENVGQWQEVSVAEKKGAQGSGGTRVFRPWIFPWTQTFSSLQYKLTPNDLPESQVLAD